MPHAQALAIERANSTDAAAVRAELLSGTFPEVLGNVSFDSETGQNAMDGIVLQFGDGGRQQLVYPLDDSTAGQGLGNTLGNFSPLSREMGGK